MKKTKKRENRKMQRTPALGHEMTLPSWVASFALGDRVASLNAADPFSILQSPVQPSSPTPSPSPPAPLSSALSSRAMSGERARYRTTNRKEGSGGCSLPPPPPHASPPKPKRGNPRSRFGSKVFSLDMIPGIHLHNLIAPRAPHPTPSRRVPPRRFVAHHRWCTEKRRTIPVLRSRMPWRASVVTSLP